MEENALGIMRTEMTRACKDWPDSRRIPLIADCEDWEHILDLLAGGLLAVDVLGLDDGAKVIRVIAEVVYAMGYERGRAEVPLTFLYKEVQNANPVS